MTAKSVPELKPGFISRIRPKALSGAAANSRDEFAFLPAAIEVESTPPSPAGRAVMWLVVSLFVITITWATLGFVDVVAVAQGKVVPTDRVKQIQPMEFAVVREIHVQEGEKVKAGDRLLSLDTTQTEADVVRLEKDVGKLGSDVSRLQALENWFRSGRPITGRHPVSEELEDEFGAQHSLLGQQKAEFNARYQSLVSERRRLQAEREMTLADMEKSRRVIPLLNERVGALRQMYEKNFGSKEQFLGLKQSLIEEEQNLLVKEARIRQLEASEQSADGQIQVLLSEQRRINLDRLNEAEAQYIAFQQELVKAKRRNQLHTLKAPIDGRVEQLAVHTGGAVVEPAKVLMQIVPDDSSLEVEAFVLNKDVGFVEVGQPAEVKVDTFNFTKYGVIEGQISDLSGDAIQDEQLGLIYPAVVKLKQDSLGVGNRMMGLFPGMSVVVEVKTGKRRIIEYFLSPLLRYKQESIRER